MKQKEHPMNARYWAFFVATILIIIILELITLLVL
jgi:hypothetical protein